MRERLRGPTNSKILRKAREGEEIQKRAGKLEERRARQAAKRESKPPSVGELLPPTRVLQRDLLPPVPGLSGNLSKTSPLVPPIVPEEGVPAIRPTPTRPNPSEVKPSLH